MQRHIRGFSLVLLAGLLAAALLMPQSALAGPHGRHDGYHGHKRSGGKVSISIVTALPRGYRTYHHRGNPYYFCRGRYYRPAPGGYVIVQNPPRQVVVLAQPQTVVVREPAPAQAQSVPVQSVRGLVRVDPSALNVRSGPGMGNSIVATTYHGHELTLLGTSGDWLYVRLPTGVSGWVYRAYTTPIQGGAVG